MNETLHATMDLAQLGEYLEKQQLLLVTEPDETTLGAGINKFRLCGVGPCDLWPGFELWLDSDTITAIAAGGSIGAAIALMIPDPIVSKSIAAFLETISAVFTPAAAHGTGLFVRGAFIPTFPYVTPIMVCYQ